MTAAISFREAIAQTQTLVDRLAQGNLAEGELASLVSQLVATKEGARGLFVGYLTHAHPVADEVHGDLLRGLGANRELVTELLVKNLAMATAQSLAHSQGGDPTAAADSQRVARRTSQLITHLSWPEIYAQCQDLALSTTGTGGSYGDFLSRWGYSAEQLQVIQAATTAIVPKAV
jgi:hypothetical protein